MTTTPNKWRTLARKRAWIITILERRIDSLEKEIRDLRAGGPSCP